MEAVRPLGARSQKHPSVRGAIWGRSRPTNADAAGWNAGRRNRSRLNALDLQLAGQALVIQARPSTLCSRFQLKVEASQQMGLVALSLRGCESPRKWNAASNVRGSQDNSWLLAFRNCVNSCMHCSALPGRLACVFRSPKTPMVDILAVRAHQAREREVSYQHACSGQIAREQITRAGIWRTGNPVRKCAGGTYRHAPSVFCSMQAFNDPIGPCVR
eukprot:6198183-Pleurochrysis_carterae.AAC.3